jgi:hypothetical protein
MMTGWRASSATTREKSLSRNPTAASAWNQSRSVLLLCPRALMRVDRDGYTGDLAGRFRLIPTPSPA